MRTPRSRVSSTLTHSVGWFTLGVRTGKEREDIAFLWLDPWNGHSSWEEFLNQEHTGVIG